MVLYEFSLEFFHASFAKITFRLGRTLKSIFAVGTRRRRGRNRSCCKKCLENFLCGIWYGMLMLYTIHAAIRTAFTTLKTKMQLARACGPAYPTTEKFSLHVEWCAIACNRIIWKQQNCHHCTVRHSVMANFHRQLPAISNPDRSIKRKENHEKILLRNIISMSGNHHGVVVMFYCYLFAPISLQSK